LPPVRAPRARAAAWRVWAAASSAPIPLGAVRALSARPTPTAPRRAIPVRLVSRPAVARAVPGARRYARASGPDERRLAPVHVRHQGVGRDDAQTPGVVVVHRLLQLLARVHHEG